MTKKTHQAGGMLVSIVGFAYLRENGLLLEDVNQGLQWLVIYPFCMWASTANDDDHHWDSCPNKDYPSWFFHKLLHLTAPLQKSLDKTMSEKERKKSFFYKFIRTFNARHRSWQTHSDLTMFILLKLFNLLAIQNILMLSAVENSILSLVLIGLVFGFTAHLVLDILTPEGIHLIPFVWLQSLLRLINQKISLPNILLKFHLVPRTEFFATGGKWEKIIQRVLKFLTVVSLVWFLSILLFPYVSNFIPYEIEFKIGG